jgi:GntR family transcriptional regulator, transcriptional repressor for pyruvate dehydrogenase complex
MKTGFVTVTLADQVEAKIIDYIKDNHLSPGDSLPNEMGFVEMMGISRNVVREAMSRLRMLGLIQTRPKRGIIVTEPPLLNGLRKVLDPNLLSLKTIKDMMGMRIALETGITDFIFNNATMGDIVELEQIVSRQQALGINNLSIEDEMQFHTKIYEIAGNKFILQFNEIMHPVFVFAKQNYESHFQPINLKLKEQNKIVEHADLLQLIKERKKNEYQNAMKTHLQPYWEFLYNNDKKI